MIYTVTFNPSLDYIVQVENFQPGILNRTCCEQVLEGGKGINVSIVLKNLGIDSVALGFIAGFTGQRIEQGVRERGCQTDFIRIQEGMTRINVKLKSAQETEINGQGPHIGSEHLQALFERLEHLGREDILVLSGSIPNSLSEDTYERIMERLKDRGARIIVDATEQLLVNVLKYRPFLIKPNNLELGEIFGVSLEKREQVVEYAVKLQQMGAVNVLVSMAGEGAVLAAEDGRVYTCPAPEGKVVNSVGAGDSMVAGFLTGYLEEGSILAAFRMGIAAGSASAFSDQLAVREDVEVLLPGICPIPV